MKTELRCPHPVWLATSDPVSSDTDTGPSDGEGNDDKDVGYRAAQPPASPMEVDPPAPEGEPSGNETGEKWRVASETRVDSAAATLAGLVAYGASSDDGSGEEEGEVEEEAEQKRKSSAERKEEERDRDADDEREEDEEVDELDGGGVSDAAPAPKTKGNIFASPLSSHWQRVASVGYTRTGWLADLNQHLRQGKTQPAMCAYMVEMEEEGLLEVRVFIFFLCSNWLTFINTASRWEVQPMPWQASLPLACRFWQWPPCLCRVSNQQPRVSQPCCS